jgi:hypothetical protein
MRCGRKWRRSSPTDLRLQRLRRSDRLSPPRRLRHQPKNVAVSGAVISRQLLRNISPMIDGVLNDFTHQRSEAVHVAPAKRDLSCAAGRGFLAQLPEDQVHYSFRYEPRNRVPIGDCGNESFHTVAPGIVHDERALAEADLTIDKIRLFDWQEPGENQRDLVGRERQRWIGMVDLIQEALNLLLCDRETDGIAVIDDAIHTDESDLPPWNQKEMTVPAAQHGVRIPILGLNRQCPLTHQRPSDYDSQIPGERNLTTAPEPSLHVQPLGKRTSGVDDHPPAHLKACATETILNGHALDAHPSA